MPASDAKAKTSPARIRSTSPCARCAMTFSSQRTSGLRTPAYARSLPVTRVSSQSTASAAANVSRARGDKSPLLPMGVPTTYSLPAAIPPSRSDNTGAVL